VGDAGPAGAGSPGAGSGDRSALEYREYREYRAVLTDRWNGIGDAANGGYMMAMPDFSN
jgi:hypothetical protein